MGIFPIKIKCKKFSPFIDKILVERTNEGEKKNTKDGYGYGKYYMYQLYEGCIG